MIHRFRSRLSDKFGIVSKQRSLVYSGLGRPPKGTFSGLGDAGKDSSDEEEDTVQGTDMVPMVEPDMTEKEYSEEETDEEVRKARRVGVGDRGALAEIGYSEARGVGQCEQNPVGGY